MAELSQRAERPLVSVVICTHDRAHILARTFPQVLRSTREVPGALEVIVVDNASTDETRVLVRRISLEGGVECRLVSHSQVGLSGARNVGAGAARAPVVWYLDDDAVPRPGWAHTIAQAARSDDAGMMGGRAWPAWPNGEPAWLPREMRGYYGDGNHGEVDRALEWPEYPFGVNMGVRKAVLEELGGFREGLGRRGRNLLSNEDKEFACRVALAGGRMRYLAAAVVDHMVPAERVAVRWFVRRVYWQGVSDALFERSMCIPKPPPPRAARTGFLAAAFRAFRRLLKGRRGLVYLGARFTYRAGFARGRWLQSPGDLR